MDGILNVYKPQNMTSHDVVAIMRRVLGIKKIGHTGTLDPMATGVLPVCVGRATKIIEYLDTDLKEYVCRAKLGVRTDTGDIWGKTLAEEEPSGVTKEAVEEALGAFHGTVMQKPPMYSAVKVNGKKLYEYARAGKDVEVKARPVYIEKTVLTDFDEEKREFGFRVTCGKGTYIRTICTEIGEAVGCGVAMSALERTKSGMFSVESAVPVDELREMSAGEIEKLMVSPWEPLSGFGEFDLDDEHSARFLNGQKLPVREIKRLDAPKSGQYENFYRVFGSVCGKKEFLGTGETIFDGKVLKTDKVFYVR